jgi:hypothetical protein
MRLTATLILCAALLTLIAYLRPPEYDEAYSIFLTAGHPRPLWPTGIFTPASVQPLFSGHATLREIAHNLRMGDVHPPLYFWTLEYWRRLFGPGWFTARLLSVLFATASLYLLAQIARAEKLPIIPTILICALSYGFAYTSIVARGFALAQFLNLLGLALILKTRHGRARPGHPRLTAFLAGLAFSLASFTNDLAIFTALGVLTTETLKPRHCERAKRKRSNPEPDRKLPSRSHQLPAINRHCEERRAQRAYARRDAAIHLASYLSGLATCLPADLYFFTAQHASRPGQFTAFSFPHALALLTKDQAAALYGGLPLYAGGFSPIIITALAILTLAITWNLIKRINRFLIIAAATPLGLLTLGLIFHNTPIEIRYCAFAAPYLALALSQALPATIRTTLITIQTAAIIGLVLAPATMQPQGIAARAIPPGSLAIIPFGNDGVGIPGPFIAAATPNQRILIIHSLTLPNLDAEQKITLALLPIDNQSKALIPTLKPELSATRPLLSATPYTLTYGQSRPHQQP